VINSLLLFQCFFSVHVIYNNSCFSTGDKWKARRKLLTPTFHFKILHDFISVFNEQSKILQEKLLARADGRTQINVFNDITLCALDIICGKCNLNV